jgi:predicted AlkP superfamily pyrophosphatase or phosphodiesterase
LTPNLSGSRRGRHRAEAACAVVPAITFPNFYTLATGLHPDRHGLISNSIEDPALPGRTFRLGDRTEVMERVWYDDGEPIWVTAERAGLRTGTLFWPGSEAAIGGVRPTYWLPFEQSLPTAGRVNMLLGWMTLPPAERPRFLTLYFDVVDTVGHRSGPDSPELNAALAEVDSAVGRLLDGLRTRAVVADLVIVADHGMAAVSPQGSPCWTDVLDVSALRLIGGVRWPVWLRCGARAGGRSGVAEAASAHELLAEGGDPRAPGLRRHRRVRPSSAWRRLAR